MELKVQKLYPDAKLPSFAYEGDGGMDLFSYEELELAPGEIKSIGTGIKIAIPEGYAGFVWDKSGLAAGGLITVGGVVDSGYRGELKVVLSNISRVSYQIRRKQKIAQLIIKKIEKPRIIETVLHDDTERGECGFGSSGLL